MLHLVCMIFVQEMAFDDIKSTIGKVIFRDEYNYVLCYNT